MSRDIKCPKCGSENLTTEKRLNGFRECQECHYRWKMGSLEEATSTVPTSPELEALKLIYKKSRNLIPLSETEEFDKAYQTAALGLIELYYTKNKKQDK